MVFKSISTPYDYIPHTPEPRVSVPKPRQEGSIIALVGAPSKGRPSRNGLNEHLERLYRVDNELLGYNLDGRMLLLRVKHNDRSFDMYLGLPFTKGVTERGTGRTELILGSTAHHGDAMQGQFDNLLWTPDLAEDKKRYGNTIRWINVGAKDSGFVGLDYNPAARKDQGVATCIDDVKFLANTLMSFDFDPAKRLFLLKPPYIQESEHGKQFRKQGLETLLGYSKARA
ncbi:hypothetical protein HY642_00315 [Candidatus Woesearchaeota archaeon]|nr:hypothetical protein [Candidatus Woesearchaeota archaeon]